MKKLLSILSMVGLFLIAIIGSAAAQSTSQLELGLSRDFGYGGFGNDIQGLFSLKIRNPPSNLTKVIFLIDGNEIGEDTQPPFAIQFNTDSYALGTHILSAVGYSSGGAEYNSNTIQSQFVSAGSGTNTAMKVIIPLFGLILLIGVLSVFLPLIMSRGKAASTPLGEARKYGIGGGAICPKCNRPFPLRLWWINLGMHKIDRCPYCGKWSFVRPRSLIELREAEAAELAQAQPIVPLTPESDSDKLQKELDSSKFQDL